MHIIGIMLSLITNRRIDRTAIKHEQDETLSSMSLSRDRVCRWRYKSTAKQITNQSKGEITDRIGRATKNEPAGEEIKEQSNERVSNAVEGTNKQTNQIIIVEHSLLITMMHHSRLLRNKPKLYAANLFFSSSQSPLLVAPKRCTLA